MTLSVFTHATGLGKFIMRDPIPLGDVTVGDHFGDAWRSPTGDVEANQFGAMLDMLHGMG